MNKKILLFLLSSTFAIPNVYANAELIQNTYVSQPTIAILDTALDTSLPIFKDKIVFEACVTQWASCPNQQFEMEGPGSSTLSPQWISKNGFDHGTQIASIAVATNPNVKIVFVRIIGASFNGLRQVATEETVYNALDWVIRNKDRFNIQAVSMSQGHSALRNIGSNYCPNTPITEEKINELINFEIPVFFPTGNGGNHTKIDWPACIPESIAVGATMSNKKIAVYSNYDPHLTDFFAIGQIKAFIPGGKYINSGGTSGATVIAATHWATIKASKPHLTYSQIYDLISKTSKPTYNSKITGGKLINLGAALNG
jgi:acid stress-induced BolA-like protein IbaG/YrbA